nr:hypothetical protein [Tanacetum cinerariifolium]
DEDVDAQDKDRNDDEGDKNDESDNGKEDDDDDDKDGAKRDDDEEEIAKIDEPEDTESGRGDDKKTESDEESNEEETREEEEEIFNQILRTPEDSKYNGNGEEDQGLRKPSILRRNKVNWHYVRDDIMFLTIKVVSRHQNTQQYGALLPIELTNDKIRNTKAYKEYYACATGELALKPKASARRKMNGLDTSITPPTAITTPITTVVAASRVTAAVKGKQPAKAKNEGTSSKPGVPDVPSDDSKEEISWNSSDDEDVDAQDKDRNDDEGDKNDESDNGKEDDDDDDKDGAKRDDDEEEIAKIDEPEDTESGRGRSFTLVGNVCPLTRIATPTIVPPKEPILIVDSTNKPVVTLVYSRKTKAANKKVLVSNSTITKSLVANKIEPNNSWRSSSSNVPSSLIDCRNDHVARIMGYEDYQIGNVTISRVYYVEGRQHTCFICNLDGVDLLTGSWGNNLYTLFLQDMMASLPICLLSKASKTKSWLWHRRLSHLNFGAINHLARQGLVRGLPKLKFKKDHLCSACAMGKSTKKTHKPKSEDTN